MRKRNVLKCLLLSLFCVTAIGFAACNSAQSSVNSTDSSNTSTVIGPTNDYTGTHTLNGFENNDDLYRVKQTQVNVDLTFSMDISGEQKKEGNNSLKLYYERGTFGNVVQLLSQTEYADCKIGDIKALSLWVYNANATEAPVTLSALRNGSIAIAQKTFDLPVGEWTKCTLDLNKVAMESNADNFYAFAFTFSKALKNATYYVDELQVEFGTEYSAADEENLVKVNDLIARINALPETITLANEESMKGIYGDYSALDITYQGAVSNYDKFELAVDKLLLAARGKIDYTKESVACYFDKFYGTFQASRSVAGFPNFSYSEEVKYKDEDGSLCIECTGDEWTYVNLSSMVPVAEYLATTCAVYNGMDTRIAAYFGWKQMTIINPGEWATFELDNRDYPYGIEFNMAALDSKGNAAAAYGNVYISQMLVHPKETEQDIYTVYDMNNPEGLAKETFSGVFTYDEKIETVAMDGYGDVLKLTATNVITYESVAGVPTDTVSAAKNVAISYNTKSATLAAYDVVKFSVYNPYDIAVPMHIMDTSWGTADVSYYSKTTLAPKCWTEIEMSAEDFVKAGKILFECHQVLVGGVDSAEFYFSDVVAYGRLYVMGLIEALPEANEVTEANAEEVLAVLTEYNKLSDEHKALVTNYEKLKACVQNAGVEMK